MTRMKDLIEEHVHSSGHLAKKHIHPRLLKMFELGGMSVAFTRAEGPYVWDDQGNRYLDLLSGGGVYFIGRNHPRVREALRDVIDLDLPNLQVVNASVLGGLLAGKLLELAGPGFSKVQYSNSGAESNEVAIRFARYCTRRRRFLHLDGSFHGRTYGAISLCGFRQMKEGMDPTMPICTPIRPNDLGELRRELSRGDVAGFFYEACQGMTLEVLDQGYLREAAKLCKEYGTLLIADEVQTGLGRLGHWFAFQEAGIVPDIVSVSKTLSGGQVPVAATLIGEHVYKRVFEDFKAGPIYFSTFAENNLAMAAGIATLEVLEEMNAPKKAMELSDKLKKGLVDIANRYDVVERVAGKGLMLGLYFKTAEANRFLQLQQAAMSLADPGAFGAAINVELFTKHRTIVQIPGPELNALKILPAVTLTDEDVTYFLGAVDDTLASMYKRIGGPAVSLGKAVVKDTLKNARAALPGGKKGKNGEGSEAKKSLPAEALDS